MKSVLPIVLACVAFAVTCDAQSLYRYRDADGNWQFSDRPPADPKAAGKVEREALSRSHSKPTLTLERLETPDGVLIMADNAYACSVQLVLELRSTQNLSDATPRRVDLVVPASEVSEVLRVVPRDPQQELTFQIAYTFMPGDPEAVHDAPEPYRVPFAVGGKYRVSQAYPSRVTHADPASRYAVDIAVPVGTPVYAARAGTVVEIAYDSYSGGTDAADLPKANIVRVAHDDGTLAIYAHLAWNSIRVRPGDRVERGEYLADSGNTGFSSGPHLHFAVQKNTGLRLTSLPVEFSGPSGQAVTPASGTELTAYR